MSYRILTKNGIDNTNIDGARGEYFNSGMRDGIVQGVLNEGLFTATASNIISLDTCELRIAGHRIVIDEPVYHTFTNAPSTDTRYAFVVQIVVDDNQNVDFSLFVQTASTPLIQNDLYKNITGVGTYQVEIGRFTLLTSLTIEDVVRTIDVITGGIGKGNGGKINIGDVTTQTLDPDVDAEVDVDSRYEEEEGKEYLDFKFSIPKGDKGDKGETGLSTTITDITASVDNNVGTPNVVITEGGEETARTYDFAFHNLKGDKGDKGEQGPQGEQGEQGEQGLFCNWPYRTTVGPGFGNKDITDVGFNVAPKEGQYICVYWVNTSNNDTYLVFGNASNIEVADQANRRYNLTIFIETHVGLKGEQGADGKDALTTSYVFSETTDPNPQDIMLIDDDEFNRTPENDEDLIVLWNNTTTGDTFICNCKTITNISAVGTNVKILNYYKLNASGDAGGTVAELVPSGTDINTYRGENYWGKTFYAGGNNTVQNTPIAGIAFSLEVLRSGAFATTQRITMLAVGSNNQPTVYTRSVSDSTTTSADGTWTAWTEVAEEQGEYPSMGAGKFIGTRVAENTDLNSLIPSSSKTALHYYCDSIAAAQTFENCPVDVPFNMITFAPQASGGRYSQILFAISMPEMIFSRYCNNNSWSAWRQYATTDGTYPDMTVGKASGDGNGNQIIAHSSKNTLLDGTTSYNFNDYVEWGNYELHGTPDNPLVNAPTSTSNPSSSNADWYLSVFKRDSVYVTQVVYSVRSDAAMAIRVLSNGNWGEWKTIGEGGGSGDYDLLYSMFSEDESVNFGHTSGLMAGDSIALNTKPYNRLKIYAWLNTIPAQIDVKINDTIKNEFVLSATPSTFTGFYFLKVQLTTVKTRFLVLKYSTFTFNSADGTFDFVQGTAHPNFYIYRIEGYEKINA